MGFEVQDETAYKERGSEGCRRDQAALSLAKGLTAWRPEEEKEKVCALAEYPGNLKPSKYQYRFVAAGERLWLPSN